MCCYVYWLQWFNVGRDYRTIIAAAKWNEEAWLETGSGNNHWAFLYEGAVSVDNAIIIERYNGFIENMGSIETPNSLYTMYQAGVNAAQNNIVLINWGGGITIPVYYTSSPQINGTNLAKEVYL